MNSKRAISFFARKTGLFIRIGFLHDKTKTVLHCFCVFKNRSTEVLVLSIGGFSKVIDIRASLVIILDTVNISTVYTSDKLKEKQSV